MNEPKLAMGFIETVGLVTAIAAADAALKSANVTVIGRENSRGDGMITVKIAGNVGAVESALAAARAEGDRVGKIASIKMIARPASGFGAVMSFNEDTVAVSSWLDSVAPGLAPGRIKRVEGRPLTGNMDLWEAEKAVREAEKARKKTVRRKKTVAAEKPITADKDDKNIEVVLESSAGSTKKNTSRRRKKSKRQLNIKKIETKEIEPDIKQIEPDIKQDGSEVKEDSSGNILNKSLTEEK